jgi:hypothetical protein
MRLRFNSAWLSINTVACRPVTTQRLRNEQLYNSRCQATAPQTRTNAKNALQQRNSVFFTVRAELL